MGAYGMDPAGSFKAVSVTAPAVVSASGNSAAIDLSNYDNGFVIVQVHVGAPSTSGGNTLALKVETSATSGGAYTDVTGATFTTVNDNTAGTYGKTLTGRIRISAANKFVRVAWTETGTFSGIIGVSAIITGATESDHDTTTAEDAGGTYDFNV